MKLITALQKCHEQSFRADKIMRSYSVLEATDEALKEMAVAEKLSASEMLQGCVMFAHEQWKKDRSEVPTAI